MIKICKLLTCATLICGVLLCSACSGDPSDNQPPQNGEVQKVSLMDYENVSILNYGAKADGSADISAAIATVTPLLGEHQAVYFPDGVYAVNQDMTVNCPVKLSGNVSIVVADGVTLTFNGLFGAGFQRIFSGNGTVRIDNAESWGYAEWFVQEGMNETQKFQKAVDSLRCMYVPAGSYTLSEVKLTKPVSIKAIGARRVSIAADAGIEYLFNIMSNDVSIEGLNCKMSRSPSAVCFYFNTAKQNISGVKLISCEVSECITSLTDSNADNTVSDLLIDSVDFTNVRGTAMHMRDFSGNIHLLRVAIHRRQYNNPVYNMGVPGAIFENVDGMLLEHFDVNGEANVANGYDVAWIEKNIGGHGCVFRNCANVKMVRSLMEYLAGTAFVIENCTKFTWENVSCYTVHGYGFDINGLTDSEFNVIKSMINGGYMERTEENVRMRNCSGVNISSLITNVSRGKAITLENCTDLYMKSVSMFEKFGTDSIGLYDVGGNKNVVIDSLTDESDGNFAFVSNGSDITIKQILSGK